MGLLALADIGAIDTLPPTRMTPSSFLKGFNLIILLEVFTGFPSFRSLASFGKLLASTTAVILL